LTIVADYLMIKSLTDILCAYIGESIHISLFFFFFFSLSLNCRVTTHPLLP
jgi:hypothetical protein